MVTQEYIMINLKQYAYAGYTYYIILSGVYYIGMLNGIRVYMLYIWYMYMVWYMCIWYVCMVYICFR